MTSLMNDWQLISVFKGIIKSLIMIDRSHDLLLHADWSICTTWPKCGSLIGLYRSVPHYYSNMLNTRDTIRNESWSWHVIYTWTLSPTIALSWLVTWSESLESRNALRPHTWAFILSPVHIKNVEFWTCCVKYFWSRLDRYIGKHIIYLVKNW